MGTWIDQRCTNGSSRLVRSTLADSLLDLAKRIDEVSDDHLGVRYLKKLDALGPRVDAWQDFPPHESYKEELLKEHGRKHSFWARYKA